MFERCKCSHNKHSWALVNWLIVNIQELERIKLESIRDEKLKQQIRERLIFFSSFKKLNSKVRRYEKG